MSDKKRNCESCLNKCMEPNDSPYCAAVNQPWGKYLHNGIPPECGPEYKLWKLDIRRG